MLLFGKSDIGLVRTSNQDCFSLNEFPDGRCFAVVCDGMGGYSGGNIASDIAVRVINDELAEKLSSPISDIEVRDCITNAICLANDKIYESAQMDSSISDMGTTAVVVYITGNILFVAHVGDSRAYLFHGGALSRITKDHSLVQSLIDSHSITEEEALVHPYRNIITRVVGREAAPDVTFSSHVFNPGDIAVLCTDGLTNMVNETELASVLSDVDVINEDVCSELIDIANANGGKDNITVVLLGGMSENTLFPNEGPAEEN